MARPTADLTTSRDFYTRVLGLSVLWSFEDHDGFDGVILGLPDERAQLELISSASRSRLHRRSKTPSSCISRTVTRSSISPIVSELPDIKRFRPTIPPSTPTGLGWGHECSSILTGTAWCSWPTAGDHDEPQKPAHPGRARTTRQNAAHRESPPRLTKPRWSRCVNALQSVGASPAGGARLRRGRDLRPRAWTTTHRRSTSAGPEQLHVPRRRVTTERNAASRIVRRIARRAGITGASVRTPCDAFHHGLGRRGPAPRRSGRRQPRRPQNTDELRLRPPVA